MSTTLPRGTVTLLFTDVEGSTQLQRRLGDRYREVIETHRHILETAFSDHEGTVVDRQTESFFCVFTRARDAVEAAAVAQRSMAAERWPDVLAVRVRMGIHAGEPEVAGDRYVGLAVSRAARICGAAHGGQVLLSSSARALLADDERAALRDLGSHSLKDFPQPESLYQLVLDDLQSSFPRPRTAGKTRSRRPAWLAAGVTVIAIAVAAGVVAATRGGAGGAKPSRLGPASLGEIDPATNSVERQVELGFRTKLIAAGEGAVWALNPRASTLLRIDSRTAARTTFGLGAGTTPLGLTVGEGSVWVSVISSDGRRLLLLELGSRFGELRKEVVLDRSPDPVLTGNAVALAVGHGAVWALEQGPGSVTRIDLRTGDKKVIADGLDGLSIAVDRTAVWIGGRAGVTRIDPATDKVAAPIPVGGVAASMNIAIASGFGTLWFAGSSQPQLIQISERANAVAGSSPVGAGPVSVTTGAGSVWVANGADGTISRVDESGASGRTIALGTPPGGIVFYRGVVWVSAGPPVS